MLLWRRSSLQRRRSAFISRDDAVMEKIERACRGEALLLAESNMDLLQMMLLWSRAGLQRRSAFISRVEHGSFADDAVMESSGPAENMDLLQMMLLWRRSSRQRRRSAFICRDDAVMEKIIPAAEEGFAAFISRIFFLQGEGEDHPCSGGWPSMNLFQLMLW